MIKVSPGLNTVKGFDISSYQPNFDFKKAVAAGHQFCFLKATEGISVTDKTFVAHRGGAKAAGLLTGAYHYYHPSSDPIHQATHFANVVGPLAKDDLPCVMDWETSDSVPSAQDRTNGMVFIKKVRELTGKDPIIYGGPYFLNDLALTLEFKNYPLWVAHYGTSAPLVPFPWRVWSFWQYSDSDADYNLFNGKIEQLLKIAHG